MIDMVLKPNSFIIRYLDRLGMLSGRGGATLMSANIHADRATFC